MPTGRRHADAVHLPARSQGAKNLNSTNDLIGSESIRQRILFVRGKRVLLDADLARFYGVGTRDLNKAVARNPDRFPKDFAFKLTLEETKALIFQTGISKPGDSKAKALMFQPGTSKPGRGGTRKPATVFTEQGVAMLASVLRSPRAVLISVAIVRAFVRLRELLAGNRQLAARLAALEGRLAIHDGAIRELFAAIRQLLAPPIRGHREIGFHTRLLPTPKKRSGQGT
jgi:hypothetical protein